MDSKPLFFSFSGKVHRLELRKRLFDLLFSLFIIALFAPLFLLIALIIRLSTSGPAIYKQPRLGKGGKVFACYKFRTMVHDADKQLSSLLSNNFALKQEWEKSQKLKKDPRVFPFGHFLRKTSLDELPQFLNVLKGDLSVVGPRPYMVCQKSELGPLAYKILSIRPGITGLWQTSGRSNTTFRKRIQLDAKYVEKRSFLLDLLLIVKTIPAIFFSHHAC